METRQATPADISFVAQNLWERGRIELDLIGFPAPRYEEKMLFELKNHGHVYTFVTDRPWAILALEPARMKDMAWIWCTWFQAHKDVETNKREFLAITRELRRSLADARSYIPDIKRLEVHSMCVHPKASHWFKSLGLTAEDSPLCFVRGYAHRVFYKEFS